MLGKSITYFIIAIQIFNLVGVTISIELHKVNYQLELRNSLSKPTNSAKLKKFEFINEIEATQTLSFKDGNEFYYEGKIYDLISIEYKNSKYYISAIEDSKEEEMTANLTNADSNLSKKSKQILSIEYLKLINLPFEFQSIQNIFRQIQIFHCLKNMYHFIFSQSAEQPPELS